MVPRTRRKTAPSTIGVACRRDRGPDETTQARGFPGRISLVASTTSTGSRQTPRQGRSAPSDQFGLSPATVTISQTPLGPRFRGNRSARIRTGGIPSPARAQVGPVDDRPVCERITVHRAPTVVTEAESRPPGRTPCRPGLSTREFRDRDRRPVRLRLRQLATTSEIDSATGESPPEPSTPPGRTRADLGRRRQRTFARRCVYFRDDQHTDALTEDFPLRTGDRRPVPVVSSMPSSSVDRSDHRDLRTRLVHFEPALADEETARPPDRSETRASGLRLTRTVSPVRATVYLEPAQPGRASTHRRLNRTAAHRRHRAGCPQPRRRRSAV